MLYCVRVTQRYVGSGESGVEGESGTLGHGDVDRDPVGCPGAHGKGRMRWGPGVKSGEGVVIP